MSEATLSPTATATQSVIADLGRYDLSDADAFYIARAGPAFEDLRRVVAELAGLVLLHNLGGENGFAIFAATAHAFGLLRNATDQIEALRPGPRCGHHNLHLRNAVQCLRPLLDEAHWPDLAGPQGQGAALLKAAWTEVVHAAAALPGFEAYDLSQACCAGHIKLRRGSTIICEGAPS
jgi:hypothetical protein